MAFYIVVRHPSDPNQLWANEWHDQMLLLAITTPKPVAAQFSEARANGERIFVHRCAWGTCQAEICYSAIVSEIHDLDKTTALIRFTDVNPVGTTPSITAHAGQNSYEGPPVNVEAPEV